MLIEYKLNQLFFYFRVIENKKVHFKIAIIFSDLKVNNNTKI